MLTITGFFSWKRSPPCHVAFRLHSHLVTLTLFSLYAVSCEGARFAHTCKPIGSFRDDVSSVHKSRPAPGYIITLERPVLLARWLCLQYSAALLPLFPKVGGACRLASLADLRTWQSTYHSIFFSIRGCLRLQVPQFSRREDISPIC
jgi:hypothetical protein